MCSEIDQLLRAVHFKRKVLGRLSVSHLRLQQLIELYQSHPWPSSFGHSWWIFLNSLLCSFFFVISPRKLWFGHCFSTMWKQSSVAQHQAYSIQVAEQIRNAGADKMYGARLVSSISLFTHIPQSKNILSITIEPSHVDRVELIYRLLNMWNHVTLDHHHAL